MPKKSVSTIHGIVSLSGTRMIGKRDPSWCRTIRAEVRTESAEPGVVHVDVYNKLGTEVVCMELSDIAEFMSIMGIISTVKEGRKA